MFHLRSSREGQIAEGCLTLAAQRKVTAEFTSASTRSNSCIVSMKKAAVDASCVVAEAGPCHLLAGSLQVKHWPAVTLSAVVWRGGCIIPARSGAQTGLSNSAVFVDGR